jgi:hypothetical protein
MATRDISAAPYDAPGNTHGEATRCRDVEDLAMTPPEIQDRKKRAKSIVNKVLARGWAITKFITNNLPVAVLTALLTLSGTFFIETYKSSQNINLERYKIYSSVDINDSNEFVKRADIVWAKASEFSAAVYELSTLYWIKCSRSIPPFNSKSDIPALQKERDKEMSDLNIKIEEQRSIVDNARKKFYNTLFANEFYLGEKISLQIALYVERAHTLTLEEEMLDEADKDAKKFAELFSESESETDRAVDRLWETVFNIVLEKFPDMLRDPDADAYLAQDLQMHFYKDRQRIRAQQEEHLEKLREDRISNVCNKWTAKRKAIEEDLRELRFNYPAARRYSLERQP